MRRRDKFAIFKYLNSERRGGFSLVELMVVLLVIAILALIALFSYDMYKEKCRAKELITFARGCAVDVIADCLLSEEVRSTVLKKEDFPGCDNRSPMEEIGLVSIVLSGCCTGFEVEAIGEKLPHYKGRCWGNYKEKLECEIVKK